MATNTRFINTDKYNKHQTYDERLDLISIVSSNRDSNGKMKLSLKTIGEMLKRDPTTLSKELKSHRTFKSGSKVIHSKNLCSHCENKKTCECSTTKPLDTCPCNHFIYLICPHLKHFPWVCNGCNKKSYCNLDKYYYTAKAADFVYKEMLTESRSGINMTTSEYKRMDKAINEGLRQGKAIDIIVHENGEDIPYSTRQVYTFIHKGYISARPIDTRRMVKLRPKPKKTQNSVVLKKAKAGRHYQDYVAYILANPSSSVIEMDTVESKKEPNQKYILTLHHTQTHFQIGILMDDKDANTVVEKLNQLQEKLGAYFELIFDVILTDNGTEFSNVEGILTSPDTGEVRTNLFYCNPLASNQKGHCEKNHTHIRYILPKGTSFKNLTQDKVDLMMSHINSYKRKSTDYSTPFELFRAKFGPEVLDILNIKEIPSGELNLTTKLLD